MSNHRDDAFVALQRLLPQHLLSRWLGKVADCEIPAVKNGLIRLATRRYGIDLEEAESPDPEHYPSFNAFFTRALKPEARPVDPAADSLACPADGAISQLGPIRDGRIFQAKGSLFSCDQLLGLDAETCSRFRQGSFCTVYLSPRDYHRVHLPVAGALLATRYIPGRLFSVNNATARAVPGLFARNERLVCLFDTDQGLMAVVLVGALFVAGIETVWGGPCSPGEDHYQHFAQPRQFAKGDEIGRFKFGSTVIVATQAPLVFTEALGADSQVRMGAALGRFSGDRR